MYHYQRMHAMSYIINDEVFLAAFLCMKAFNECRCLKTICYMSNGVTVVCKNQVSEPFTLVANKKIQSNLPLHYSIQECMHLLYICRPLSYG